MFTRENKKTDHIELRHVNRIMIIIPSVEPSNFIRFGPGPCSIIQQTRSASQGGTIYFVNFYCGILHVLA